METKEELITKLLANAPGLKIGTVAHINAYSIANDAYAAGLKRAAEIARGYGETEPESEWDRGYTVASRHISRAILSEAEKI